MPWQFSTAVDAFSAAAGPWLRRDPAANTVILSAVEEYVAGQRWSAEPPLFGWCGDEVRAVMCWFPPYALALSAMAAEDAGGLAGRLGSQHVPSVRGPVEAVTGFAGRRVDQGVSARPGRRQRLYELGRLRRPSRRATGLGHRAAPADADLVARWLRQFATETGSVALHRTSWVVAAIDSGLVWLWHDHDEPVAIACRHPIVATVARIEPVYTPPDHRRHGYGSAATAAVTGAALAAGATRTVLFADVADETANRIYTALGYEVVAEMHTVLFTAPG